eukprot:TRINITY_DN9090_c0_g1_i1.p1 TRINITY_DN9090_c0_g1~~TRINITY_DN9090_c0_g1_i1.p1  ORF type:complete len:1018 (+),score=309.09 TRINITY_DN9090_c0_g1_i1:46-3054(+)
MALTSTTTSTATSHAKTGSTSQKTDSFSKTSNRSLIEKRLAELRQQQQRPHTSTSQAQQPSTESLTHQEHARGQSLSLGGTTAVSTSTPPAPIQSKPVRTAAAARSPEIELAFPDPMDPHHREQQREQRQAVIAETFASAHEYRRALTNALNEQVNAQLAEIAQRYHDVLSSLDMTTYSQGSDRTTSSAPLCNCKPPQASVMRSVAKDGPNKGRRFYSCKKGKDRGCSFFAWQSEARAKGRGQTRRKIKSGSELEMEAKSLDVRLYCECTFDKAKYRGKYRVGLSYRDGKNYGKDDLWIVSQSWEFKPAETFVAMSTYFSPDKDNYLEIEPKYGFSQARWAHTDCVYAIHAANIATEVSCLETVRRFIQPAALPILPQLLNPNPPVDRMVRRTQPVLSLSTQEVQDLAERYVAEYHLNEDQAAVLRKTVGSLPTRDRPEPDHNSITLVHGVYGAGKSYLIGVTVKLLAELFEANQNDYAWKIMVSSTTNVAVDRMLEGLLDIGYQDFVRVGSAKKIAGPIRPYSTHGSATSDSAEARELQAMLKETIDPDERQALQASITKFKKGVNRERLQSTRVVGVTCAASTFTCLEDLEFAVIILDECCQMTEPNALLPVARFKCRQLMLVGDPKQLQPTVSGGEAAHDQGLEQTLFSRLSRMGVAPIMLRTQYRCHPAISRISNAMFYEQQLRDGVDAAKRPALVALPPLAMFDVAIGREERDRYGSYRNNHEACFVVGLLDYLIEHGIEPVDIGVICLYKAQAQLVQSKLKGPHGPSDCRGLQISTVDAFQGGERKVMVLSCVRTAGVGFIDNPQRVNVALTRAKHHLLIVGKYGSLSKSELWKRVLTFCQQDKSIISATSFANKAKSEQQAAATANDANNTSVEVIELSQESPVLPSSLTQSLQPDDNVHPGRDSQQLGSQPVMDSQSIVDSQPDAENPDVESQVMDSQSSSSRVARRRRAKRDRKEVRLDFNLMLNSSDEEDALDQHAQKIAKQLKPEDRFDDS